MTNGIVQTENGFAVKDFDSCEIKFNLGRLSFPSYLDAVENCKGKFYPLSYYLYLLKAAELESAPDADVWENMIYAEDPRGVWDGEAKIFRNVTEMDRGAATDDEIAYVDALAFTYKSLMAMTKTDA